MAASSPTTILDLAVLGRLALPAARAAWAERTTRPRQAELVALVETVALVVTVVRVVGEVA
jgi:hypothetical protein